MQELDDNALLREYVERGSEEAFAALVTRHINKVHSVARRHTGNPHQAEAITQAVFITLARKARHLGKAVILSGWLYQTARLTSITHIRGEIRRARREHEAHMQTILNEGEPDLWTQIAPQLDAAMAALGETDRHAVVLHYFDGKSMKEIAGALGASEDASKKRVSRAVEKLRRFFSKRGVILSSAVLTAAISAHSVQAAPVPLAKSVTAIALSQAAAASVSTLTLVKAFLLIMKTKTVVLAIASAIALVLAVGTSVVVLRKLTVRPRPAAAAIAVPVQFANDTFTANGANLDLCDIGVDPNVRRTADSAPAIHIKCAVTADNPNADKYLVNPDSTNQKLNNSSTLRYNITNGSPLMGKHIRISGWLKASDVQSWAGVFMLVLTRDGHRFAMDDMGTRPLRGTTDWQPVEFVTDTPNEPCLVYFGPNLSGPGELWGDDFQIDLAPPEAPITDDRSWHKWSQFINTYSETAADDLNAHDGHRTVCLAYSGEGAPPPGAWMWWGQSIREADRFEGHTVRLSAWVKGENVTGVLNPNMFARLENFKQLATSRGDTLKGTRDWTQLSATCIVPKAAKRLDTGFYFAGNGKVWIDMDSVKCDIVK